MVTVGNRQVCKTPKALQKGYASISHPRSFFELNFDLPRTRAIDGEADRGLTNGECVFCPVRLHHLQSSSKWTQMLSLIIPAHLEHLQNLGLKETSLHEPTRHLEDYCTLSSSWTISLTKRLRSLPVRSFFNWKKTNLFNCTISLS